MIIRLRVEQRLATDVESVKGSSAFWKDRVEIFNLLKAPGKDRGGPEDAFTRNKYHKTPKSGGQGESPSHGKSTPGGSV